MASVFRRFFRSRRGTLLGRYRRIQRLSEVVFDSSIPPVSTTADNSRSSIRHRTFLRDILVRASASTPARHSRSFEVIRGQFARTLLAVVLRVSAFNQIAEYQKQPVRVVRQYRAVYSDPVAVATVVFRYADPRESERSQPLVGSFCFGLLKQFEKRIVLFFVL